MADLNDIGSSETVRIAGANASTGLPTNWMQVDAFGTAQTGLYNSSGTSADFNFGAAGSSTLRVAALIGNATGAAGFGAGTTTAQVLRVVLPTDQSAIPTTQSGLWTVAQGAPNTVANSWPIKITDGTNTQTVSANGDSSVSDGLSGGGLNALLSVPTANTAVEIKVGASRLANRKFITFQAVDGDFYWGYANTVTAGVSGSGTLIKKNATAKWAADPTASSVLQIWVVSSSSGVHGKVTESP